MFSASSQRLEAGLGIFVASCTSTKNSKASILKFRNVRKLQRTVRARGEMFSFTDASPENSKFVCRDALLRWPKSVTAISISSRQFQFHHGNFNFVHGNFNFVTAVSISPRQFQLRSRQFQLRHGNFNFTTAISILSRQFQLQFQFHHRVLALKRLLSILFSR